MIVYRSKFWATLRVVWHRMPALVVFVLAAVLVLAPLAVRAQTGQGAISGRVADAHDAVVPGAEVTISSVDTGVQNRTVTNNSGVYNVLALNPGTYKVEATAKGFKKSLVDNVIVGAAQVVATNIVLTVGGENTTVTVTSQDSLLTKDVSDVSTTVDHALVENLPYPERSSLGAVLLVPGVTGDPLQPGGVSTENPNAFTSYVTPGASITVGGAPPGTTSFLIDGSDATQASYARAGVNLSGRDVQETTVIVGGMSAKYGRTGAGVIIQTSRAGTSQYHGGVTWRHTDPFFNAYPLGGTLKSNQHENFYGFYVGGPVRIPKIYDGRNKTFFFVGVEPARMQNTLGVRGTFHTPAELAGHFHDSLALLNQSVLRKSGYAAALAQPRVGTISYQSTTNAAGFPNGPRFANNTQYQQVTGPLADCGATFAAANPSATSCPDDLGPQLAQNPFAQFIISNLPSPTNPGPYIKFDSPDGAAATDLTNGSYARGVINVDNRYSFRIDHQFNNSNGIFVRYTRIPVSAVRFFALAPDNPLNPTPTDSADTHNIALGYTHIFTNNLVNSFHYSWLRVNQQRLAPPSALTTDFAAKYGLTPASFGRGLPTLGNFNSNGANYTIQPGIATASIQVDQNFIVGDDVTWTHDSHVVQFGFDIRRIQSSQYDLSGSTGGRYGFSSGDTAGTTGGGAGLATFILGTVSGFSNTPLSVPGYYRWHYYAGYLQDDWRATPNLTINVGLRYEVETPRMEAKNNQAFVGNIASTLNGMATSTAFCFSNACGNPKTLWPTNYWGLEPRIGISYAASSRTTIRASYGMSRVPLSGYENVPDPNFNVAGTTVNVTTGGTNPANITNYISNPVASGLTSAFTVLKGRGPFAFSTGLAPVFVNQSSAVPYIQTWALTVQYQPFSKTLVQATYQGLKGTHLVGSFASGANSALNTAPIGVYINAVQTQQNLGLQSNNTYGIRNNSNDPASSIIQESALQKLAPYQNFFNQALPEIYPRNGTLEYNGMYVSVNQRYNSNLSFLANYTWTKSLDNIPDTNGGISGGFGTSAPQNPFDIRSEYALSTFDQPSKLRAGYTYNLPFGIDQAFKTRNGLIDRIIGNISTSGIMSSASGYPNFVTLGTTGYFTAVLPGGVNGCTVSGANKFCSTGALPSGYTLRPDIVPGVPLINPNWKKNPFDSRAPGGVQPYLNPAAFTVPGSPNNPRLGNAPRTLSGARSPREFTFDMRFVKGFTIKNNYQLNINATFSNVFNHPVYYGANHNLYSSITTNNAASTPTGVITNNANASFGTLNQGNSQGMSRVIRFGAEFNF